MVLRPLDINIQKNEAGPYSTVYQKLNANGSRPRWKLRPEDADKKTNRYIFMILD